MLSPLNSAPLSLTSGLFLFLLPTFFQLVHGETSRPSPGGGSPGLRALAWSPAWAHRPRFHAATLLAWGGSLGLGALAWSPHGSVAWGRGQDPTRRRCSPREEALAWACRPRARVVALFARVAEGGSRRDGIQRPWRRDLRLGCTGLGPLGPSR
jgi:hypothetical protein